MLRRARSDRRSIPSDSDERLRTSNRSNSQKTGSCFGSTKIGTHGNAHSIVMSYTKATGSQKKNRTALETAPDPLVHQRNRLTANGRFPSATTTSISTG